LIRLRVLSLGTGRAADNCGVWRNQDAAIFADTPTKI
jgi:hypothetical protein